MKKIIILMVAFLMATAATAQVSPRMQRDFNRKAYELIKTYSRASQMSDDRDKTQFFDLFENPDVRICNDLMGLNYEPTLSVSKYVELLDEADMVTVGLRNVKKEDEIVEEDGRLVMSLSFLKRISFLSPCNTMFDSYDFFGRDYHIQMTLVYDPESDECRIRELSSYGVMPKFPADYRVLVQTDERDNNLDINGKYINFLLGQKILRPTDQIYYRGAKVKEKDMKEQCDHKVYATYNDKTWRVRLNGGFSVTGSNRFGNSEGTDVNKYGETSFGLDFGYIFPTTSHLRFGIFAGVGLSFNNIDMSMALKDSISSNQDVDNQSYNRIYISQVADSTLRVEQKMSATNVTIPIYLDMEYEFNSIFSVYADAGIKLSLPMSHSIEIENDEFYVSGKYSDYDNLEIFDGINDFGYHKENTLKPHENGLSAKTAIDAILGFGARVNVTKTIAIDAGIQYQMGCSNSWTGSSKSEIFSYELGKVEDYGNGGTDMVNLMNKVESLKHSALKANVSLIFKF